MHEPQSGDNSSVEAEDDFPNTYSYMVAKHQTDKIIYLTVSRCWQIMPRK